VSVTRQETKFAVCNQIRRNEPGKRPETHRLVDGFCGMADDEQQYNEKSAKSPGDKSEMPAAPQGNYHSPQCEEDENGGYNEPEVNAA